MELVVVMVEVNMGGVGVGVGESSESGESRVCSRGGCDCDSDRRVVVGQEQQGLSPL